MLLFAALDARKEQELKCDLLQRFSAAESQLSKWLHSVLEELQASADESLLSHSRRAALRITGLQHSHGKSKMFGGAAIVEVDYQHESKSSAFGSWTAQVLSKSAQGEDGANGVSMHRHM